MVDAASSEETTFPKLVHTSFVEVSQDAWERHMIKLHDWIALRWCNRLMITEIKKGGF